MTKQILALAAFAALSCASFAQGFGGGPGRGMMRMFQGGKMATAMLLNRPDVQEELKLDDSQKGKLDALRAGARDRFMPVFQEVRQSGLQGEDFQKAFQTRLQTLMDTMAKEALDVLSEAQRKRAQQLAVQSSGAMAVLQADVAKELVITPAQKAQIEDLQRRQEEATMGLFEKLQSGELQREQMPEIMQKNSKIMDESIRKLLTETQRAKLKELEGTPFAFKDPKPGTPGSFGRPGGGL
ncbi:hypothetical protein EON82_04665 [bacterium]|nr:MAG: hypothetical protein EON82_04665 [bacterium]